MAQSPNSIPTTNVATTRNTLSTSQNIQTPSYFHSWQSTPSEGFSVFVRKTVTPGMADITISSTVHASGWVGFGFGSVMENSDIMICWANEDGTQAFIKQKLGVTGGLADIQPSVLTPLSKDSRLFSASSPNGDRYNYLSCRFTRPIPQPYPRSFIWASSPTKPLSEASIGIHQLNGAFTSEFLSPSALNSLTIFTEANLTRSVAQFDSSPTKATIVAKPNPPTHQLDTDNQLNASTLPSPTCSIIIILAIMTIVF